MRRAARTMCALIDTEMSRHVRVCAGWGMTEADMAALPEEPATIAYTRFVLDRGMAGDLLDLQTALVPCIVGYAELGRWLAADPATKREGNPSLPWIEMYDGVEYQEVPLAGEEHPARLLDNSGGEGQAA